MDLQKSASASEIKLRFYKLAKEHHPDLNKDVRASEKKKESDEELFKKITVAYDVLSDPEVRQAYDEARNGYRLGSNGEPVAYTPQNRGTDGGYSH